MGRQCVLERKRRRGAYHFEEDVHVFHGCLLGDAEGDCWDRSRGKGDGGVYVSKVQSYSVIIVIIIVIVIILIIIIAPSYLKGNLLTLKAAAAAASRSMSTMAASSEDKRRS